jgi:CcmD family protein
MPMTTRLRRAAAVLAVAAALASPAAAPLTAQAPESTPAAAPAAAEPGAPALQTVRRTSDLPSRARAPRTLRAYWHVFAAFAFAWVLLFGYVVSIGRRLKKLEESAAALSAAPAGRRPTETAVGQPT